VILNGLDVNGGELTVYEKNLSDGTSPDASALTQSGTFTVTALDGLQTLTVGGINVVTGGVAAGFPQSVVTPLGSTLTITGYNPATGVVSYSYTLVDNETHPTAMAPTASPRTSTWWRLTLTAAPPAARSTSTSSMICRARTPIPPRWRRAAPSAATCSTMTSAAPTARR
jgi:hypothetical protein